MTKVDDIPPGVDFHDANACVQWADEAAKKRPWRVRYFEHFAAAMANATQPAVLELGSGPGFLAEHLLSACPNIERYTLLDFAEPMLDMSRARLQVHAARTRFVQADFRLPSCVSVGGPFDIVVSMQAVHELRHKRHATALYCRVRELLSPGGVFLVCDHLPGKDPSPTRRALYMTLEENRDALAAGGFTQVRCVENSHDMALLSASA
jgi:ubiquinone/menaquinone biosynthesis C-methylase UbiE